ncbi:hypothetical protein [Lysobacter gummosus]|uniref:hypothetical protein n=1 Tax=Lysobacter gummosus TaxID=262324 RepID=UPI00362B5624
MALNLRTPGVYIVEESKFPPSVVPVETAIPAFSVTRVMRSTRAPICSTVPWR